MFINPKSRWFYNGAIWHRMVESKGTSLEVSQALFVKEIYKSKIQVVLINLSLINPLTKRGEIDGNSLQIEIFFNIQVV